MTQEQNPALCAAFLGLLLLVALPGARAQSGGGGNGDQPLQKWLRNFKDSLNLELLTGKEQVDGLPLIVGLRVTAPESDHVYPPRVYLRDLASTFERYSGIEMLMLGEQDSSPNFLLGRRDDTPFDAPDRRVLLPGESVVMWIDLAQLVTIPHPLVEGNEYPQRGSFPRAGLTKLACTTTHWGGISSSPIVEFDVREATAEEARIGGVLEADGVGRSWFPATLFLDEEVPESSHLPPESRRIVAFIDVMRKALRDSNQGLITIQSYDFDLWGYMAELISMVEYECLRDTGRNSAAISLRSSSSSVAFGMVDRGDGLVRRLRRVRDGEVDYLGEMSKRALEEALEQRQK